MRVLIWLGMAVLCVAANQSAAQGNTRITKDESKLILKMPGLDGGKEAFQYFGWNSNYTQESHYAAQVANNDPYPRAQVYYNKLTPGASWRNERRIDESSIRAAFPFFKNRDIAVTQPDPGGGSRERRLVRFSADGAECVHFGVIGGGTGISTNAGYQIFGIYCSAVGAKLTATDIDAVFNGWRIHP